MMQWRLRRIKRRYHKREILANHIKIWRLEFLLEQLKETRESSRREHDRITESIDAAQRRLYSEKYTFHYSATGDVVDVMNLSLPYSDIEKLPDKPTDGWRFHKVTKPNPDPSVCENLQKAIDKLQPDVEQLQKQMDAVDERISKSLNQEGDGGIIGAIESFRVTNELLKKYLTTI